MGSKVVLFSNMESKASIHPKPKPHPVASKSLSYDLVTELKHSRFGVVCDVGKPNVKSNERMKGL